jgi:propionyl-CoA carboxylase alpha chain
MSSTIRSILVANRGEIARRVFRTARDLGIATVAVHSDADAHAPFVGEADRAVRLPGNSPADTYLRGDLVIAAAKAAGADAIHPGYGFLSENADFARQVAAAGLTWIGPTPDTIDSMGSKIEAKKLMKAAGVPILEVDPATATADDFPLLVKASAGGGGRGMRVVERAEDLQSELDKASAEALSAFGDGTVFVEPYLPTARHVEVQVLADTHGTVWILGDRDCSIQRRHQKVVEEAPAPGLTDGTRKVLHDAARAAAQAVDYVGAGTVEFLVDEAGSGSGASGGGGHRAFFLEMNTRLQVEHPVTEMVTGIDIVKAQLQIAAGEPLKFTQRDIDWRGHAVECRINAEDPKTFMPSPGTVTLWHSPGGPGIRVDSHMYSGYPVPPHYDSLIGKLIAHGENRASAIARMTTALSEIVIDGIRTNVPLHQEIFQHAAFRTGGTDIHYLEKRLGLK